MEIDNIINAAPPLLVACPRCAGCPDMDEDGGLYACHFCCDQGEVPAAVADAEARAEQDRREQFKPRQLGIYLPPLSSDYDDWCDEWDHIPPGYRMFSRLVPRPAPAPVLVGDFDDITF